MSRPFSEKQSAQSHIMHSGSDTESSIPHRHRTKQRRGHQRSIQWRELLVGAALMCWLLSGYWPFPGRDTPKDKDLPAWIRYGQEQCDIIASSPPSFKRFTESRKVNERWAQEYPEGNEVDAGTWLKNATLWTGEEAGSEVKHGWSVWLKDGVIRKIGSHDDVKTSITNELGTSAFGNGKIKVAEVELNGSWVTPGIVDMHSHLAVDASPSLNGADDTNSLKSPILPYLRSLDAFNTRDQAFNLSIAGGITTMLVLPGSAGNIGGQAYVFKPRRTGAGTPDSMAVEPPFAIVSKEDEVKGNGTSGGWKRTGNWRHIKHACGENAHNVYGNTRMDSAWDFRHAYNEGRKLIAEQDKWCASPATQTTVFPESMEWEPLADVIRGKVKVNVHCYETTDLDMIMRLSNEFKFPVAAVHHAHEAYLVPDLLKKAYGPVAPAVAIFATNARYKREAYRGTEFAGKLLTDAGLDVAFKSDHPVLDSRFLVYEAAQGHHYGMNWTSALSAVTTTPAKTLGMDHRLGFVRPGYDADLSVWDSFPLTLGATPKQTYIDGIPQIESPHVVHKGASVQQVTAAGEYDEQALEAFNTRGEPDLSPRRSVKNVMFTGVKHIYTHNHESSLDGVSDGVVLVEDGEIVCVGDCAASAGVDVETIDLKGGSIAPGLITVGSYLGLMEIRQEKSTADGPAYDPLFGASELVEGLVVRAVDGAQFGGKDELLAHRAGVTTGVAFPISSSSSLLYGLSYAFTLAAPHALVPNAILNPAAALHLSLTAGKLSISTKIAALRRLLQGQVEDKTELTALFNKVHKGEVRLVIEVHKADVMAALLRLKKEVGGDVKMTFMGGFESWMIAEEIAAADVGVIVSPARSFPATWSQRRIIPGPPLSARTLPSFLHSHGVKVGLGINEEWMARNTRYDAAWVHLSDPETVSRQAALDMASVNLVELLGLDSTDAQRDTGKSWAAYEGDVFTLESRARAVRAPGGLVDVY